MDSGRGEYGLKDKATVLIIDTTVQRDVHSIVLAFTETNVLQCTRTGEVVSIFMEGAGHDSVGAIKSFFDTITMMNININIHNTRINSDISNEEKRDILE